ncbi:MAG: hypothetical protein ABIJ28_01670, partial [Patescibacteria group bacterium]
MTKEEIQIFGKKLVSLKKASEISGYAKDYIGQLCRASKIDSKRIGRDWFVDIDRLLKYKKQAEQIKKENGFKNSFKITEELKQEKNKISYSQSWDIGLAFLLVFTALAFLNFSHLKPIYARWSEPVIRITDNVFDDLNNGADVLSAFLGHSIKLSESSVMMVAEKINNFEIPDIKIPDFDFTFDTKEKSFFIASVSNSIFSIFKDSFQESAQGLQEVYSGLVMFPQNIKELAEELFTSPPTPLLVGEGGPTGIGPGEVEQTPDVEDVLEQTRNTGLVIQTPTERTIVERTIERVVSGLSSDELDTKLKNLNSQIMSEVNSLKSQLAATSQALSLTNRINNLGSVTINNATFTGSTSGLNLSGDYLALSGGTITGALTVTSSTTFNGVEYGWPSSDGAADQVLTTNGAGVLSWSTASSGGSTTWEIDANGNLAPTTTLAVYLPSSLYASSTALFDGAITVTSTSATSTFPYLRVSTNSNLGTVVGGTWQGTEITDAYISDTITASNYLSLTNWFATTTHALISSLPSLSINESQISDLNHFDGSDFYTYFSATTTDYLSEGSSNLYWTNNRFDIRLTATSTLPAITTLANLASIGTITSGIWNANAIDVTHGGTAQTSWTQGDMLYASAANTLAKLAIGTNGYVLQSNGSIPTWVATSTLGLGGSSGTVTSVSGSGGTTGLTLTGGPITTSGTLTLGGTLAVANGGTGLTSYTSGD